MPKLHFKIIIAFTFPSILLFGCRENKHTEASMIYNEIDSIQHSFPDTSAEDYHKIPLTAVKDSLDANFGRNCSYSRIYISLEEDGHNAEYITGKVRRDSTTIFTDVISPDRFKTQSIDKIDSTSETFTLSEIKLINNIPGIIQHAKKVKMDKFISSSGRIEQIQIVKKSTVSKYPFFVIHYTSSDPKIGVYYRLKMNGKMFDHPLPYNYYDTTEFELQKASIGILNPM